METKYNILLVDDHPSILYALKHALKEILYIDEIVGATHVDEALKILKDRLFDAYILDLTLKGRSGFDLIEEILKIQPDARIIVHTQCEEIWVTTRLLQLQVDGIVLKTSDFSFIQEAVNTVFSEKTFYCPNFSSLRKKHRLSERRLRSDNPLPSDRELEILKGVTEGLSAKEIGQKMNISTNTVETHKKNLAKKLNAKNASHLTSIAFRKGLIDSSAIRED